MTQRLSTTQDSSGHSVWSVGCRSLIVILAAFFLATASVPESATAVDKLALRRKQIDQQRARAMAQKLVSSAVDLQIHQLEDNGLTELPIYKEITSMRGSIGELVETEMADVVEILLDAQHLDSAADREAKFVAARSTIREIVIRLAVERHNLLRRLRNAEIAEQIKRLIRLETETMTVTKGLPEESQTRREQLAVRAIEDQRDIKELFLHLVETLADVSSWDGAIGQGATKGLVILKREEVGLHLDRAGAELAATKYASSAVEQAQVVAGLKKLLDEVLHTQGLISSDSESIFARIEELANKQSEIRAKVQNADLSNTDESTALTTEQDAIKAELEELAEVVADNPQAAKHVEEAIEAAAQASEQIFSEAPEQAINAQRLVEGHLAALQDKLQQEIQTQLGDKTAAELAETVKSLEATKAELEQAMKSQQQADQNSATDPTKAARRKKPSRLLSRKLQKPPITGSCRKNLPRQSPLPKTRSLKPSKPRNKRHSQTTRIANRITKKIRPQLKKQRRMPPTPSNERWRALRNRWPKLSAWKRLSKLANWLAPPKHSNAQPLPNEKSRRPQRTSRLVTPSIPNRPKN